MARRGMPFDVARSHPAEQRPPPSVHDRVTRLRTIALVALALLAAAAPADAAWEQRQVVGDRETGIVGLDADDRGNVVVATNGARGIELATGTGVSALGPPLRVEGVAPGAQQVSVELLAPDRHVLAYTTPIEECESSCSEVGAAVCTPARCDARTLGLAETYNPELAIGPGGRALVSWDGHGDQLVTAGSLLRGGAFGPTRTLAPLEPLGVAVALTRDGGEVLFADGRRGHAVVLRRLDRRGRLGAPRWIGRLARVRGDEPEVRFAGPAGRQVAAWVAVDGDVLELRVAERGPSGRLGRSRRLGIIGRRRSGEPPPPPFALDVAPSGAAALAWTTPSGAVRAISRRRGARFGRVVTVQAPRAGMPVETLTAAAGDAGIVVGWSRRAQSGPSETWVASRAEEPVLLERTEAPALLTAPDVTIDASGRARAGWTGASGATVASDGFAP